MEKFWKKVNMALKFQTKKSSKVLRNIPDLKFLFE